MIDRKGDEKQIPESQIVDEALTMARKAQQRNGKADMGSDEEVLAALRMLYKEIVPSCRLDGKGNPVKGDAQSIGNSYAGPLFDPDTCKIKKGRDREACGPFAETASKQLNKLPDWIVKITRDIYNKEISTQFKRKDLSGEEAYYRVDIAAANAWYQSNKKMFSEKKAINKDRWKKKKDNNDDSWAVDFANKQMELAEDPRIRIRSTLWEKLGLLTIGSLFFDKNTVGNLWNRLAVRLAVAHLLSWESWNHATEKDHNAAMAKIESLKEQYKGLSDAFSDLRRYESVRHGELKNVAFFDDERPFRIGARAIRAWDRVRETWIKDGHEEASRKQILKDLQTKLRGKFGDPDLFNWLAAAGREHLWKETDAVTPLTRLNVAQRVLERRKKYSLMTFADARRHPRWAMYEAPGGSNLRNYAIRKKEADVHVEIPLLVREENGNWKEKTFSVKLAPSGQLLNLRVEEGEEGKKIYFKYRSAHHDFEGIPGGAELLFDRRLMENGMCQ